MAIRSESERRKAEEQVEYLQAELEKIPASEREDEVTISVINGLRMHISDIKNELTEYERLKKGLVSILTADSFDDIGELVIKARIARGWSQADLAEALDMKQQQVQRYERNDWEKISLWRLQEVIEALRLRFNIRAYLDEYEAEENVARILPLPHWEKDKIDTPNRAVAFKFRSRDTYVTPNRQRREPLAAGLS